MPYPEITEPLPGPKAFELTGDVAWFSQAAVLLGLGLQLSGALEPAPVDLAKGGIAPEEDLLPRDDVERLQLPSLTGRGGQFDIQNLQRKLLERYGKVMGKEASPEDQQEKLSEVLSDLARRLYKDPNPRAAAELFEASLRSPSPLVRVAAAASYLVQSTERPRLLRILAQGAESSDELVRDLAATVLARVDPQNEVLRRLTERKVGAHGSAAGADTTLLVHGTWGRSAEWWRPGGDFHTYIRTSVVPDLYSLPDRFDWTGGYSDPARGQGAQDLLAWVTQHNEQGLNLITHSHGGNISMLATHAGLQIGKLILLSCPVHFPKYEPDFPRIKNAVSVRVHFDLVILADRGHQRFRHARIREVILPIWFNHSATHEQQVWIQHSVSSMI